MKKNVIFNIKWVGVCFIFIFAVSSISFAQIVVYPISIIASNSNRFGTFYVSNKSQQPQQVTISYRFGYPTSDSLGNVYMQYKDSLNAQKYSCAKWIKSYPSKFILPPGQRQTIRMLISPPSNLKNGVYWTRLVTNSKPEVSFPDTSKNGVVTHIVFAIDHITSIMFRNGNVNAKTQIKSIDVRKDSTGDMEFLANLHRIGNAPFLGNAVLQIYNGSKKLVKTFNDPVAVYFNLTKRFAIDPKDFSSGTYTAKLTLNSNRDVLQNHPEFKIAPISKKITFTMK